MARVQASDFLHSMRFHVTATRAAITPATGDNPLAMSGAPSAGFMSVSTPEATTEAVEYREGIFNFPRKFPGNTTVSDCSMQKGVARADGAFWAWLKTVIAGPAAGATKEYRADLEILHFDRSALKGTLTELDLKAVAARTYTLKNAFPTRHKVAADLDASSSDISIMELDVAYESFTVKKTNTAV